MNCKTCDRGHRLKPVNIEDRMSNEQIREFARVAPKEKSFDERLREMVAEEVNRQLRAKDPIVVARTASPRELRERAGISVEQAAERAGLSRGTVRNVEAGRFSRPPFRTIGEIARGCAINETLYTNAVMAEYTRRTGKSA